MESSVMQVAVSRIKPLAFNPQNRTVRKSLAPLMKSIRQHGILVPVVLTADFQLVDGHRRVECARLLGMEKVPAIINAGDPRQLFAEVNGTQKRLTNRDYLEVYLSGGGIPPARLAKIKLIESYVGRSGVERIAGLGLGPGVMQIATMIANYCGIKNEREIGEVIMWVAERGQSFAARRAMAAGIAPNQFRELIASGTALPY